jgi:hypothetical protein
MSVVRGNDRLWQVMGQVRRKRTAEATPLPAEFVEPVAALRRATMQLVHTSKEIPAAKAQELNKQADALRTALERWLQSNP